MKQLARAYNLLTHKIASTMFNFTPPTSHTRADADRRVASLFLKRFAARCTSANSAVKARFLSHDASRTSMETCTRSSLRWNTSLGEKAAGRPLPKTLALRPREACKTAPNKECRYHIASKSLTARTYGAPTTTLRNSPRRPKSKAAWRP